MLRKLFPSEEIAPSLLGILVKNVQNYIEEKRRGLKIDPKISLFANSKDAALKEKNIKDEGLDRAVKYLKFLIEGGYKDGELFFLVMYHTRRDTIFDKKIVDPLGSSYHFRLILLEGLCAYLSKLYDWDHNWMKKEITIHLQNTNIMAVHHTSHVQTLDEAMREKLSHWVARGKSASCFKLVAPASGVIEALIKEKKRPMFNEVSGIGDVELGAEPVRLGHR